MERKDLRTKYPSSLEEYLEEYGRHFNTRLFEFATSMMEDRNGNKLKAWDKDRVESMLKNHGISLRNAKGHDAAYVLNMAMADYWGSSITDEQHLALYVKDYIDDRDGSQTRAFDEFYIKMVALGIPVFWDEML